METMILRKLSIRQEKTVIPERWKMKRSVSFAQVFCLENNSGPQCWDGKIKEFSGVPELSRKNWEFRQTKVARIRMTKVSCRRGLCRKRTQRVAEGSPPVFIWVLIITYIQTIWSQRKKNKGQIMAVLKRQSGNLINLWGIHWESNWQTFP